MVPPGEHPAADGEVSEEEEGRERRQRHPHLHPLPDAPGDSSRDSGLLPVAAAPDALSLINFGIIKWLQLIQTEGWGGLYSGLKPSLIGTAASQVKFHF